MTQVIIAHDLRKEVARGSCLQIHGTALPVSPNPLIRFMPRSFTTINHGRMCTIMKQLIRPLHVICNML